MIVFSKKNIILSLIVLALAVAAFCQIAKVISTSGNMSAKNYVILIHVDDKKLYLLNGDGQVVKKYTIATGKSGFSSPIGDWKIINKGSRLGKAFGARWLGLNVPWGVYGIHGTNEEGRIGQSVSHGCIRLRNKDIVELYNLVSVGTPVVIRNGPYGPFGWGFKTLTPGARGADVLEVQKKLKELGYYAGLEDGIYGEDMKEPVHQFQREHGLKVEDKITHEDYVAMGFIEFD
jgi:ribosomal protein L14E/L6E/L27E